MRTKRLLTAATLLTLVGLARPLCGDDHPLRYKIIDRNVDGIYTSSHHTQMSLKPEETLRRQPKYRSKMPLYGSVTLGQDGDQQYTLVLDESQGTGCGYDVLYLDRNNNEDLTDDPKIAGRLNRRSQSYTRAEFGPAEVMIEYPDRTVPYHVSIRYYHRERQNSRPRDGARPNLSVNVRSAGCYAGEALFGGVKRRIAIVDYNSNGVFTDLFKVKKGTMYSGGGLYATGDVVVIDTNGDGQFDKGHMNPEMFPFARYIKVESEWYTVKPALHGGGVEVLEPDVKLGTIQLASSAGTGSSLMVLSDDGVLRLSGGGSEFEVPEGMYQLFVYEADARDGSERWHYQGRGTAKSEKIEVARGKVARIPFGAPIRVNVTDSRRSSGRSLKPGDRVYLGVTLTGKGGEAFSNITKNDRRPPAPTFKVVDEKGKTVASGTFEYG